MEVFIIKTKHIKEHILEIKFNDGHISVVDFAPFIFSANHPDYEKYKKVDNFLKFEIDDGNLNWDDYTMIFDIQNLYDNNLIWHF